MLGVETKSGQIDAVQQAIEAELMRLARRVEAAKAKGSSDFQYLKDGEDVWIVFIRPDFPDESPTRGIYFLDKNLAKPAVAVVWSDQVPADVFNVSSYRFRLNGSNYAGFDIADGCEWQPAATEGNSLAVKLLRNLPDAPPIYNW